MQARVYWIHTLTPTHAGVGRGLGYIDLPIDRDCVTKWPIIRGSAIKGVWRDWTEANWATLAGRLPTGVTHDEFMDRVFGRADDTQSEAMANSGALMPTDARLVCLPVRSFHGTFAWITSPLALQVLSRTLELAGSQPPSVCSPDSDDTAFLTEGSKLVGDKRVFLEDLDLNGQVEQAAGEWAKAIAGWVFPDDPDWQKTFQQRFAVVPDAVFDYLCETGTEVHTRVRIDDDTKTVVEGALWTEEALPAETILAGLLQCDRIYGSNSGKLSPELILDVLASKADGEKDNLSPRAAAKKEVNLQVGGKATAGYGQVRCVVS